MKFDYKKIMRTVPDFPEEGVLFRDITPILHNPDSLKASVDDIADIVKDMDFDFIAGPESRGFIFGVPVSYKLHKGFIPVRKEGKLPAETVSKSYDLEYGSSVIEIHKDAIKPGDKIVIVDDLLATGGTVKAITELVEEMGGVIVGMVFFIELLDLNARDILKDYNIVSLVKY